MAYQSRRGDGIAQHGRSVISTIADCLVHIENIVLFLWVYSSSNCYSLSDVRRKNAVLKDTMLKDAYLYAVGVSSQIFYDDTIIN